ncbi:MAG: FemAB family PEP-CTERM system-associated protein [Gammaproteobacteria bacterium]|nr:FemAB family PEP-CTERM system-associated protein [Gammaproteobacteria bacterium]
MVYTVKVLVNKKDKYINQYVGEKGTFYHLTEWSTVINNIFNNNVYYVYVENDQGSVCGVLPLVHIKSRLFGNYMVSMPYFNYGGLIADNNDVESILMRKAIELANDHAIDHIEFRDISQMNYDLPLRQDKVNMILELPESTDELAKILGSKKRSQIRRPLKEGVNVKQGGIELLYDFYSVFSENMRDLGTPVYPRSFFKEILETFQANTKIIVLYLDNKPISAAFLIGYKNQLEIPWASTLSKYNYFSPNMLLYWEVLRYAIEKGYKRFDFGRSTIDSGTYKFKKQWGAKPLQLYWHYWLSNSSEMPKITPDNPKYRLAIKIWQNLPLTITNLIGPIIIKNLP